MMWDVDRDYDEIGMSVIQILLSYVAICKKFKVVIHLQFAPMRGVCMVI